MAHEHYNEPEKIEEIKIVHLYKEMEVESLLPGHIEEGTEQFGCTSCT